MLRKTELARQSTLAYASQSLHREQLFYFYRGPELEQRIGKNYNELKLIPDFVKPRGKVCTFFDEIIPHQRVRMKFLLLGDTMLARKDL